tara:strand:+ start:78 stop:782 length:705 start_codon:yes stop_codon:yes gene_type:complete
MSNKKLNKVFIHQPDFAPWMTFFKRLDKSDIYVILDDVQFNRRGFTNRDYILLNKKKTLLTIPVIKTEREKTLIKDVKIDYKINWLEKMKKSLYLNYSKSVNFNEIYEFIGKTFEKKDEKLMNLNLEIIYYVIEKLKIKTKLIFSSNLKINSKKSEKILDICKEMKATHYITGKGSLDYLNEIEFKKRKILINDKIFFNKHYNQNSNYFVKDLSIIDVMFNISFNDLRTIIKEN